MEDEGVNDIHVENEERDEWREEPEERQTVRSEEQISMVNVHHTGHSALQ